MGSAHSAGHALVILVWSLAGRGEATPRWSGPKGLWAKLDDRSSTGHRVCLALRIPALWGAHVGCKAGATRRSWHASVLTGCSRLDTAKHERPSRVRPVTRHGLDRSGRSGPCSEWTRSVLRAGRVAVGNLVSMGNLKS